MKKTILIAFVASIATLISTLVAFEIKAQRDQLNADKIEEIDSEILNESRKLLVHLPRDYSSNPRKQYPVLYTLDGTSHDQEILNAANILRSAELLPELIIIGIPNKNRNSDLTPHYIAKDDDQSQLGNGDRFLAFLEKEAIPLIENKYRTTHYRMLSGHSRAGLFSFFAMLEKPNLFNAHFCYSPAFWRNESLLVSKTEEFLKRENPSNQFLYLSLGSEENDKMKKGFDAVVKVLNKNKTNNLESIYNYTPHANHGTNPYYSIPLALKAWNDRR